MNRSLPSPSFRQQDGMVLLTALMLLLGITVLSMTLLSRSGLQERLASNHFQVAQGFELNESALAIATDDYETIVGSSSIEEADHAICIKLNLSGIELVDANTTTNRQEGNINCAYFQNNGTPAQNELVTRTTRIYKILPDRNDISQNYGYQLMVFESEAQMSYTNGIKKNHILGYSIFTPQSQQ